MFEDNGPASFAGPRTPCGVTRRARKIISAPLRIGTCIAFGMLGFGAPVLAETSFPEARSVTVARATAIPACTSFVDAASSVKGSGTAEQPYNTIAAAVEAVESGAVICVAEGTYAEEIAPGEKYFTLAGGFQGGQRFKVREFSQIRKSCQGKGKRLVSAHPRPRPSHWPHRSRWFRD